MKATGYNSRISWISLGAVAVIGFLIALPMRLLGLFFVLILDSYNVDREQALIPIVTYGTMRTLSGPLVGFLGEIWGLQAIILIGCILASIGVGLSCFTEDIITLTISLGLIYGYFRGHLESYDGIYYVYIGICVFCGILVKFTPNLSTSR